MNHALHDPEKGYYARNIQGIGARGDFTTAPQLSTIPAKAIADWASEAMRKHGTRDLIEIGSGLGTLSSQILAELPFLQRLRTRIHLVESSPALSARQKALLGNRATYHPTVHSALAACSGKAVIFSNELVDAFPVRLFRKTELAWQEVALEHSGGKTIERLLPPAPLPPSSIFTKEFPIGQRIEIHDSYRLWLESWLLLWTSGELLTIDYGDTAEHLYNRRPHGSLRAYLLHQRIEGSGIYLNPGLQDLTADVNFTDLTIWASPWLDSCQIQNFGDFMQPFSPSSENHFITAARHFQTLRQTPRNPNSRADSA